VSVLLLQTAMVLGLLFSRAARRRAERARGDSEAGRRLAEGDLLRQRDELAHAQRVATLGELTASFAHEIKQPLTAMVANAQAVGAMLPPQRVSAEVRETLQDLAADAIRAADTIERIQAMFRKQPAVRSPLDLNALIDDVLRLLASDIRHRQITVQFTRAPALSPVVADDIQLRQVILNILRNAEEAITSASGTEVREIRIETSQPHASQIELAIRDSGVGVDEKQLEQMFEHFVTSKPQGLGLGLAISRSIIESHGGRIWATRNDGAGITLHVRLPC
jgi:C4-dicarboxylate-specific signal transduction histidine kinase